MCIKRAVFGKPFPSAPCRHPLRGQRKHPDFGNFAIYIRKGPVAQRQLSQIQASYNATPANDNYEACKGVALSRSDSLSNPGLRQKQLRQTTNIEACKETFCPVPAPSFPFVHYLIGLCQNSRLLLFFGRSAFLPTGHSPLLNRKCRQRPAFTPPEPALSRSGSMENQGSERTCRHSGSLSTMSTEKQRCQKNRSLLIKGNSHSGKQSDLKPAKTIFPVLSFLNLIKYSTCAEFGTVFAYS